MADVLNTSSRELRASVNEAQAPYNATPWIIITRAQFDLWATIPLRYRKWTGVAIEEMTGPEKAAADAAALEAARDEIVQQIDGVEDMLRAVTLSVRDAVNLQATRVNAILDAIDGAGSLAALKTTVAGINNLPTYTMAELRAAIRAKLGT